jgi:F-type H+-transporting ATPase subunit h
MYLRELQAYKPAPLKANDSEGHVQAFSVPKPPASPEEANLAAEIKDFEAQVPEIEGNTQQAGAPVVEEDWFEEDVDEQPAKDH